jgi:hypothetical protein
MNLTFLEDRAGCLSWATLHRLCVAAAARGAVPEDARHMLKERLKSEVLPLVLNSLTVRPTGLRQRGSCAAAGPQ